MLLSYLEVRAYDAGTLGLVIQARSRSARNLAERGTGTLVLIEFFKAFAYRSDRYSTFERPFANRWLNLAVTWELLLLVLQPRRDHLQTEVEKVPEHLLQVQTLGAADLRVLGRHYDGAAACRHGLGPGPLRRRQVRGELAVDVRRRDARAGRHDRHQLRIQVPRAIIHMEVGPDEVTGILNSLLNDEEESVRSYAREAQRVSLERDKGKSASGQKPLCEGHKV